MASKYSKRGIIENLKGVAQTRKQHFHPKFESEIMSSLLFQMIIYFSVLFFPMWYFTTLFTFLTKMNRIESLYHYITIPILIFMPFVEVCRLYLGFEGNLREKVPELGGSWLLTLLIQFPLLLYFLLANGNKPMPLELSAHSFYSLFQAAHLIEGFLTIKKIAKHQVQLHYIYSLQE